ncbi:MAG: TIGR03088 family PEP-CTERM/XrtA system glycosyltransferase [Hydrogenophilaceae bacterium]|nr:TIGR03088 family PEP-CTERM/XrtA system glycosyltransferase [Hydrogenophilaceae bacterium]
MQRHVAHLVYAFDTGGMENGMVNLFNNMPYPDYRHTVIALTGFSDFRKRITAQQVDFRALNKKPGNDPGMFARLYSMLRELKPDILHTRNLAALEGQFVGALSGVGARVHGEHGRDNPADLNGKNWKYNFIRKTARHFVHEYICVSHDLKTWLHQSVGVTEMRIHQIYNGVDTKRFLPRNPNEPSGFPAGFATNDSFVIGTVGRMTPIKDHVTLIHAFSAIARIIPKARLLIVGDGSERKRCQQLSSDLGISDKVWFTGERNDVPGLMQSMDVFVLPSISEGISNTILEAMASGLPVIATRTGGNVELVEEGHTGLLTPVGDVHKLSLALIDFYNADDKRREFGKNARSLVESKFSLTSMAAAYSNVYEQVLQNNKQACAA